VQSTQAPVVPQAVSAVPGAQAVAEQQPVWQGTVLLQGKVQR